MLGFGAAKSVLIHVNARHCRIVSYQVDSQEIYQIKTADLESGVLDIWLDRLTSGANVRIALTGTDFITGTISLSAASDQGVSAIIDSPTFSNQVDTYTRRITGVLGEAGGIIWTSTSVQEIRDFAFTRPTLAQVLQVVSSDEFKTVALAALIMIFLMRIFLPREFFVWGIPIITASVVWLFFDFLTISTPVVIGVCTIILVSICTAYQQETDTDTLFATVTMQAFLLGIGCLGIWWYWYHKMPVRWILTMVTGWVTLKVSTKPSHE